VLVAEGVGPVQAHLDLHFRCGRNNCSGVLGFNLFKLHMQGCADLYCLYEAGPGFNATPLLLLTTLTSSLLHASDPVVSHQHTHSPVFQTYLYC
jgi:hypothetical protein